MGFYYDHIVPHLVNLAMRNRLLKAYRERIVRLAEGRVLEIAIDSGMNLPFYTERATGILGLEPHPKLLGMASPKAHRDRATLIRQLVQGNAPSCRPDKEVAARGQRDRRPVARRHTVLRPAGPREISKTAEKWRVNPPR
jgi:hypothetical protein